MGRLATLLPGRTCDTAMTWADRAVMRGLAVALVSNSILSALSWQRLEGFYDAKVSAAAFALTIAVAIHFVIQVARRAFRLFDVRMLVAVHILSSFALVVAPKSGAPSSGLTWTHPWMTACICAVMLLLTDRERWPLIIAITGLVSATFSVLQATLMLMTSVPEVQGRALGILELVIGSMPLGTLLLGTIANQVGVGPTTFMAGAAFVLIVAVHTLRVPDLLRYTGEDDPPVIGV